MGCGKPPHEVTLEGPTTRLTNHYHYEVLESIAAQLGLNLEDKRTELDTVVALRDETLPSGILIRKGTVGGTRRWIGVVNGKPFITCESRWTVVRHIPGWEPDNLWQITIEGEPALRMQYRNGTTFGSISRAGDPVPDLCHVCGAHHPGDSHRLSGAAGHLAGACVRAVESANGRQ
jgi:hypothetical protein